MAIALDVATAGGSTPNSTITFSHTCTGSNLILFVAVMAFNDAQTDPSSVTYNGVSMTKIGAVGTGGQGSLSLWYLLGPATGANNVVVGSTGGKIAACAASYTGVQQSGQPDSSGSQGDGNTFNSTARTPSTTVVGSNCWVIGIASIDSITASATLTSNITDRTSQSMQTNSQANDSMIRLSDSNGVVAAGSYTVTFTPGQASHTDAFIASFLPAPAAVASGNFFDMF